MLVVLSVSDFLNQSKINLAFPVGFTVVWERQIVTNCGKDNFKVFLNFDNYYNQSCKPLIITFLTSQKMQ